MSLKQRIENFSRDVCSEGLTSACLIRLFRNFRSGPIHDGGTKFALWRLSRDLKKGQSQGAVPWNEEEFHKLLKKHAPILHLYFHDRWEYLGVAAALAMKHSPRNILELGCYRLPLFKKSDVMDLKTDIPRLTFRHDLTRTPWPIKDKTYDLVVALQVWEHLGDQQEAAFREVMRVSRGAVLSFPYLWNKPGDIHHGIDKTIIARWTLNYPPEEVIEVGRRIIYRFRF